MALYTNQGTWDDKGDVKGVEGFTHLVSYLLFIFP